MEYSTVSETKSELPSLVSGGVGEAPRLETTGPIGSVAVMGVSTVAEGLSPPTICQAPRKSV